MLLVVEIVRASRGAAGNRLRTIDSARQSIQSVSVHTNSNDKRTSSELGGSLGGGVGLDSVEEIISTFRVLDVLDSEVHSLLHVSVSDDLVDNDSDSSSGDVVDDSGSTKAINISSGIVRIAAEVGDDGPVVVLVRHTLLLSGVGLDVDDISDLVDSEEGREGDHSFRLESSLEHITRTRAHSEGVRHF